MPWLDMLEGKAAAYGYVISMVETERRPVSTGHTRRRLRAAFQDLGSTPSVSTKGGESPAD